MILWFHVLRALEHSISKPLVSVLSNYLKKSTVFALSVTRAQLLSEYSSAWNIIWHTDVTIGKSKLFVHSFCIAFFSGKEEKNLLLSSALVRAHCQLTLPLANWFVCRVCSLNLQFLKWGYGPRVHLHALYTAFRSASICKLSWSFFSYTIISWSEDCVYTPMHILLDLINP